MKHKILFAAAAFFFGISAAFSQSATDSAVATGTRFLIFLHKGEDKSAWELFDHKNVPNVTADQFCSLTEKYVKELADFDTPVFEGQDATFMNGKKLDIYFFDAAGKERHAGQHVDIQVFFVDGALSVAGLKWKAAVNPGF